MFKYTLDNKRYHTLNYFYKNKFGIKVFKLSLNAGFTCPNLDGTKGYSPKNCRWVTIKEQNRNKKNSHLIEYKGEKRTIAEWAEMYGIKVIEAERFYASSKICSCCGHIKKDLKLSDRTYICPVCGAKLDRDLNAAINLANYDEAMPHRNAEKNILPAAKFEQRRYKTA